MFQRPLLRLVWAALLPALLVYVLALLLSGVAGIQPLQVIRDLAQTCDTAMGVGLISNLGYLLWISAAAIALFVALSGALPVRARMRQLFLSGGLFSLLLCLDDMFLLHDRYISSNLLFGLYVLFALLILLRFRRQVQLLGDGAFLLAVLLLGLSLGIDQFQELIPVPYSSLQILEEGAKFLGIATWLGFWWQAGAAAAKLKA